MFHIQLAYTGIEQLGSLNFRECYQYDFLMIPQEIHVYLSKNYHYSQCILVCCLCSSVKIWNILHVWYQFVYIRLSNNEVNFQDKIENMVWMIKETADTWIMNIETIIIFRLYHVLTRVLQPVWFIYTDAFTLHNFTCWLPISETT